MSNKVILQQSPRWFASKNLEWIIKNAHFAHSSKNAPYKIWIVTRERLSDNWSNAFELDTDGAGISLSSITNYDPKFSDFKEKNFHVILAIEKWLYTHGGREYINPSLSSMIYNRMLNIFRSRKIKYASLKISS